MLTARQLVEPSSSKRKISKSKTEKPEKTSRSKDKTPEEKEARREERRIKKHEREAKKAAEMTALLGIPKMKRHRVEKEKDKHRKKEKAVEKETTTESEEESEEDKGKDKEILVVETPVKEPKKEHKLKSTMADQFVGGLMARKPTMTVKRTGSAKREVGPTPHLSHYIHIGDNSLNIVEDSSTEPPKIGSERRHHHHHEHSSPESELSCGPCIRRARRRREERAIELASREELVERRERREREATEGVTLAEFRKTKELQRRKMEIAAARIDSRRSQPLTRPEFSSGHAQHPDIPRDPEIIRQGMRNRQRERDMERIRAAVRAVGRVEVIPARRTSMREESPARQAETMPERHGAVPERPTASQVEIIPARQTNRTHMRQAEMRAQRHEERPQPQPPPHPVERLGRAVEIAPTPTRGQPRGRSQPGRSAAAIQPERSTAARRQSTSVQPTERAPPQPQPTRPILGFELEDKPEKLIECVTCMDDEVPSKEAAKLACGHWFCNECLRRLFLLSMTDPAHMPPKCCTSDHIPLEHAENLLWHQEKKTWNNKYLEYTTANRLYCPTTDCGEWIQPKYIQNNVGQCQKCKKKVCATCNGPAHGDGDCPSDPDTLKFIETAEKHKYQRCYSCRAMVELERGCNHMTCHCTAQFCYVCGSKWKSCDCPWFNYESGEAERWPVPPHAADRLRRAHRARLRIDEEVARRLARAAGVAAPGEANEDLAREPAQLDPLGALGTLGLGVRNGIRRLAADYIIEAARAERPAPTIRRRTEPIPPAAPGLARVNAFYGAAARPAPAQVAPVVVQASPPPVRNHSVHAPGVPLAAPRSNFLTASQQANVERYIAAVDLDGPQPAVGSPFHQLALDENDTDRPSSSVVAVAGRPALRRSNTDRPQRQAEYVHRSRVDNAAENGGRRTSDTTGARLGLAGVGLRAALEMSGTRQFVGGGGDEGRRR